MIKYSQAVDVINTNKLQTLYNIITKKSYEYKPIRNHSNFHSFG